MKFGRLGGLNTFSNYDIFNLQWAYRDGGLPMWLSGEEFACQSPGLGKSPGEGNSNPLQYSCLGNSIDIGAWQAAVHGVAKSQKQLSN